MDGNFNFSQAFDNVTSQIETQTTNITTTAVDYIENYVETVLGDVESANFHIDDLDFPPIPVGFDIDVPAIPECDLQLQFDDLELYVQIDTTLSGGATYTLNLYESETIAGFTAGENLLVGVVFSIDLILSVDAEIDISSGFHIQLNDGLAINIPIFDQNVSSITL